MVDAKRFALGFTYQGYLDHIKANRDQFQRNYEEFKLSPEDARPFLEIRKRLGTLNVVALGEDWCPDVWRGLPIMAQIAAAAGIEMRVFPRDQNTDIIQEYLKDGKFMSIPVFAFYNSQFQPLCHWIERPQVAVQFMERLMAELGQSGKSEEERRAEFRRRLAPEVSRWRQETVRELKELLSKL